MTLLVEKGTFTKTTSTSTPVSQQVTLSNSSLTPKFIILWTTGQTTINGTYTDDARLSYGFSDTVNDGCVATMVDESAEQERISFRDDSIMCIISLTAASIVSQATISSVAAGSFTLSWSVQSDTSALHIHYIVAGGTDITNVNLVSTAIGDTLSGNHSYNGTGTTFTPDFALCITGPQDLTNTQINTLQSAVDWCLFCIGAAKSASEQFVVYKRDETVATSDSQMYIHGGKCVAQSNNTTGAVTFEAGFVSFDNAAGGGITLDVTNGATVATSRMMFLLIKGGDWDCGTFQQRSGTGTQNVTLDTGLDPSLVFLTGINSATAATFQPNGYLGLGASDGTNEGCSYVGDKNALATWECVSTDTNTKVYRQATPAATAASSTTNAECDMTGMTTAGQFTLDWTTADTTLRQIAFWALGPLTAANAVTRALATETVTLSDSRTRLAAKIRTRTDTAITVGESRARLAAKLRPLAPVSISVGGGSVVRIKGKVKSLATEAITVAGGTLARLSAKIRTRSDTIILVDNRARLAAKNRALATQTITVGAGTLAKIKGAVKAIPQTIAVGENLARLNSKTRALATQTVIVGTGAIVRLKAGTRALATQTVTIGENLARIKGILRSIATQTIIVTGGTLARLGAKTRILATQTIIIAEDLQRTLTAGAQNIVKTISQTVTLGESIARLKASQRLTSQTIVVGAGIIVRLSVKIRAIPETIVLTDNRARLSTKLRALAVQTVAITDNRARIKGAVKTISQTTILSENISRLSAKIRALSLQTIAIGDNVARQIIGGPVEIIRSLTQTVVLSDSVGRRLAVQRILSQTLPMAESLARVRGVLRTLSQSIPVSGSPSRIKSAFRMLSQTLLSSDSITRLNTIRRTISQTVVTAENVAAETVGNLVRSLVETVTVSDSITRRTAKLVILDQVIAIAEQVSRISAKLRIISVQTITLGDSVTQELNVIIKHAIRTLSQIISITDYTKIEVIKKSQRFRKILQPSIKRLISNHPAWLLGTRGMHNDYEEFSP